MKKFGWIFVLAFALALGACRSTTEPTKPEHLLEWYKAEAPMWDGMGDYKLPVTTTSDRAQAYFNQGLAFSHGFNHDEAVRSYAEAVKADDGCAMAWWGIAYARGPNINLPMFPEAGVAAYLAIQGALARKDKCTELERDLIDAMATRYENPPAQDQNRLDRAFAAAMAKVWEKYPDNAEVGFVYADSLLNISPWDQWTKDGEPKENTLEIVKVLERTMEINPNHPGANHLYIHTMEASLTPGKAEVAADRLGGLIPGIGHIVHMPAHIYMRLGRYQDSVECNREASKRDAEYFAKMGPQFVYHIYHAHNDHFLIWSAMFEGRYEDALEQCKLMDTHIPEFIKAIGPADGAPAAPFLTIDLEVHIRFGKWQAILDRPMPREDQPYAVAMWHYARGLAYANTKKIDEARKEAELFEEQAAKVPEHNLVHVVPAQDVFKVCRAMLAGETEYKAGNFDKAFEHLRAAVEAERNLRYTEPSPFMVPTRHALGALLLMRGKYADAEQVFRDDLALYPENGWALIGLADSLEMQDKTDESKKVRERFKKAWSRATVVIKAACFCATE